MGRNKDEEDRLCSIVPTDNGNGHKVAWKKINLNLKTTFNGVMVKPWNRILEKLWSLHSGRVYLNNLG